MDAALVIGTGGIEVQIGVDLLLLDHSPLDILGDLHDAWSPVLGLR